jgi:outer membrane protein
MKKAILPLMLVALFGGRAEAADLLSVYRDALSNDAQFASAKASLVAGREKLPQARAGLLPNLGLTANTVWNDVTSTRKSDPPTTLANQYNTNGYTLALTQPLFRWQNIVQYDQSKLLVAQAESQFAQARQDLILRVAQAYFDVLLAQDSLQLAQAQKQAISEQLEQAKRNFEVGTATITDTHEAQARYDLAVAQELAAQNDLDVKRHALRQIIGKEPEPLRPLRPQVRLQPPQPADMGQWVKAAEQDNFLVQVAQAGLEIAAKEVEKQRAGHYPSVDVVATRSRSAASASVFSGVSFGGSVTESNTIGVQLSLPLFAGFATVSRTDEAAALREKALADLENSRRTAAQGARQAYLGVTSGLAQVKALEQALVSSQSALESNRLGYEVGVRINIDVLNAQQQVYATQRDLAKARYDTLLAQLRLKAAAAALGEDDVQQINALLQ